MRKSCSMPPWADEDVTGAGDGVGRGTAAKCRSFGVESISSKARDFCRNISSSVYVADDEPVVFVAGEVPTTAEGVRFINAGMGSDSGAGEL